MKLDLSQTTINPPFLECAAGAGFLIRVSCTAEQRLQLDKHSEELGLGLVPGNISDFTITCSFEEWLEIDIFCSCCGADRSEFIVISTLAQMRVLEEEAAEQGITLREAYRRCAKRWGVG